MAPKKIAFIAIALLTVIGLSIAFYVYSGKTKSDSEKWPSELSVWVVGDDTDWFVDIIDAFKKEHDGYKDTNIVFTKFASYQDYEKSLINVIADGNSPDVFVVPSTWAGLLESKIEPISDSYFDGQDLSGNLNRLFDPLIELTPGKTDEWADIQIMTLRGAPLWYETLGALYNRAVLDSSVPASWEEFSTQFSEDMQIPPPALGFGSKYITQAPSIASLFLVQNSINSIENMGDSQGIQAIENYVAYSKPSADPYRYDELVATMNQKWLTMTDMFVRGKVSVLFWYPSILREIEYSMKRAGTTEAELEKRDLRSTPVPQKQSGKKVNLARYNYFAVSKFSQNIPAASEFVGFLTTKAAGNLYSVAFPQYIPARNDVLAMLKEEKRVMNKTFQWVQYDSFIPSGDTELVNFDQGLTSEFEQSFWQGLDIAWTDVKRGIETAQKRVSCRKKQLFEAKGFEVSCEN